MEPKAGLYDNIILLLDFNSLYPSIIREYNICFSTVERKPTEKFWSVSENELKSNKKKKKKDEENETNENEILDNQENEITTEVTLDSITNREVKAILPSLIEGLVNQRKEVKKLMKYKKDKNELENMEIQQKALKLSANSLYGYLGYKNSRFYAKEIAALITQTGRNILEKTVELVSSKHNLEVIYGDTDSIMIQSLTNDISTAMEIGQKVKHSVNEKYKLLEMEIDGAFKTLLLLRKKKYAALKYDLPITDIDNPKYSKEYKGLDLVRRDWCELSKQVGLTLLDIILDPKESKEETIFKIVNYLTSISQKMEQGEFTLDYYAIVKQLTKKIEDYSNAISLPHVKVAKRLIAAGDSTIKAQSTIPYIVCKVVETDSTTPNNNVKAIADRAYHIKEVAKSNGNLIPDLNWYKENQLLSSVSRLCKHIQEIDMYRLAQCLGIDSHKYETINKQYNNDEQPENQASSYTAVLFGGKKTKISDNPIKLRCTCGEERTISYYKLDCTLNNVNNLFKCGKCQRKFDYNYLYNKVIFYANTNIKDYFSLEKTCSMCQTSTKQFLSRKNCKEPSCRNGKIKLQINEGEVTQNIDFACTMFSLKNEIDINLTLSTNEKDVKCIRKISAYGNYAKELIDYNKIELDSAFADCII